MVVYSLQFKALSFEFEVRRSNDCEYFFGKYCGRNIHTQLTSFSENNVLHKVRLVWIVSIEVQAPAFFSEGGAFNNEVSSSDHVP